MYSQKGFMVKYTTMKFLLTFRFCHDRNKCHVSQPVITLANDKLEKRGGKLLITRINQGGG